MHGDGSANIVHANSLEKPSIWDDDVKRKVQLGEFDIVVTNPPFGTNGKIDNPNVLEQFELTTFKANSPRTALPPEQLFIERCLDFLKPGLLKILSGRTIPKNPPGLVWIRKWIFIIKLPHPHFLQLPHKLQ